MGALSISADVPDALPGDLAEVVAGDLAGALARRRAGDVARVLAVAASSGFADLVVRPDMVCSLLRRMMSL